MSGARLLGPAPTAPRRGLSLPLRLLLLTAAADALLWVPAPGLSLGLAAIGAAGLILWRARRIGRGARLLAALLALSAVQSAIEVTDANEVALLVLLFLLLGEAFYPALAGPAARLAAALRAMLRAALGWRPLWRIARHGRWRAAGRLLRMILPAVLLALPFAILLGLGNAVMGEWLTRGVQRTLHWLARLDLSLGRVLFWLLMATLALALLRPAPAPRHGFATLSRDWPLWRRADPRLARWQGIAILLALNMLFLVANTADALHLWARQALPAGVSYSGFVHQGTDALILATLLSGVVITVIFQQAPPAARSALLRGLALAWIAQNLVLLGSVALRLWLYVEAYQLTLLRVWLALFLLLVAGGFLLLAWHVLRGIGLRRLVLGNAALALGICVAVQFVDLPGLVARTNVRLWQDSLGGAKPHRLDLEHLVALGPSAWPPMMAVAAETRAPAMQEEARSRLADAARRVRADHPPGDWRSIQRRPDAHRQALLAGYPE